MNVHRLDDSACVSCEYSSLDRLGMPRLHRTGWLRFDELDEEQTLVVDVVTWNHTLYHLAGPDRSLAELARVLRRGGRTELLRQLEAPDGPYPFVATRRISSSSGTPRE